MLLVRQLLSYLVSRTINEITTSDADKAIVDNKSKVTEDQIKTFLNICWTKYVKAKIEPGRGICVSLGGTC